MAKLKSLAEHIMGREVPLIRPGGHGTDGPLGAYCGAIDLLNRDPETGEVVVAEFKTDRLESQDDLARRSLVYAPQEEQYARAVQEMLHLDRPPRTELWWLWPDHISLENG